MAFMNKRENIWDDGNADAVDNAAWLKEGKRLKSSNFGMRLLSHIAWAQVWDNEIDSEMAKTLAKFDEGSGMAHKFKDPNLIELLGNWNQGGAEYLFADIMGDVMRTMGPDLGLQGSVAALGSRKNPAAFLGKFFSNPLLGSMARSQNVLAGPDDPEYGEGPLRTDNPEGWRNFLGWMAAPTDSAMLNTIVWSKFHNPDSPIGPRARGKMAGNVMQGFPQMNARLRNFMSRVSFPKMLKRAMHTAGSMNKGLFTKGMHESFGIMDPAAKARTSALVPSADVAKARAWGHEIGVKGDLRPPAQTFTGTGMQGSPGTVMDRGVAPEGKQWVKDSKGKWQLQKSTRGMPTHVEIGGKMTKLQPGSKVHQILMEKREAEMNRASIPRLQRKAANKFFKDHFGGAKKIKTIVDGVVLEIGPEDILDENSRLSKELKKQVSSGQYRKNQRLINLGKKVAKGTTKANVKAWAKGLKDKSIKQIQNLTGQGVKFATDLKNAVKAKDMAKVAKLGKDAGVALFRGAKLAVKSTVVGGLVAEGFEQSIGQSARFWGMYQDEKGNIVIPKEGAQMQGTYGDLEGGQDTGMNPGEIWRHIMGLGSAGAERATEDVLRRRSAEEFERPRDEMIEEIIKMLGE
tara:strand:+ start:11428 stop:13314 length:1887 start_codon:yes stop_codon:yes gene_type:complete